MKKINSILSMVLLALVIGFASCSKQTPVTEFCSQIDKFTKEINDAKDLQQLQNISTSEYQANADKILEENADYVLTDADKAALKKSMINLIKASISKQAEFFGYPVDEKQVDDMAKSIEPTIDAATTFGDIDKQPNGQGGAQFEEVEEIVEEITPDSIAE